MRIFCDESGYTGNRLSDPSQPYFSLAAVCLDDGAAESLASSLRDRSGATGEIKASRLLRSARGQEAVRQLLVELNGSFKAIVCDKRFALAAKFYEYTFEPIVAAKTNLFYGVNFHRYISNYIHMASVVGEGGVEQFALDFEESLRRQSAFPLLRTPGAPLDPADPMALISEFCEAFRDEIEGDYQDVRPPEGVARWILDLSVTSLASLLREYGKEGKEGKKMTVICDESKPLQESAGVINALGSGDEPLVMQMWGRSHILNYSLAGPIEFAKSHESAGVMLADIVAGVACWSCKNENRGTELQAAVIGNLIGDSVFPDLDYVDLDRPEVVGNAILLQLLVNEIRQGRHPLQNAEMLVAQSRAMGLEYLAQPTQESGG